MAIAQNLLLFSVDQPQIIGEPVKGTTGRGGAVRISLSAPAEEGITVRFCVREGSIILYASTTVPNPSSAINDWSTEIRAPQYQHTLVCSTTFFDNRSPEDPLMSQNVSPGKSAGRSKRQVEEDENSIDDDSDSDSVTLYFTIEGQDNFNEFSLNSSQGEFNFGMIMINMNIVELELLNK